MSDLTPNYTMAALCYNFNLIALEAWQLVTAPATFEDYNSAMIFGSKTWNHPETPVMVETPWHLQPIFIHIVVKAKA